MDSDSTVTENKNIHNLTDEYEELNNGNNQDVIVVDGRGYENAADHKKEIFTLVDIIEDTQNADKIYDEILRRMAQIVERITREMVPEIAERVIREEIEKIKIVSSNE
ncbi:MAG: hypothetical protein CVU55_01725 [Deltaproteobacteria bacterium HGW-Deltaproteobacteria-13]|jgi:hypothetical protein|nr:MAG: hypothetical protein CVU55_01725 [Deltaproteobacteria bacterium HGW-Deltaproteobacteria-13]